MEDSKIDVALVLEELRNSEFTIDYERVETPEEMLEALQKRGPWDLILSDYTMPRFSALAALKLLQETSLDIPFIIISGSIGEEIAVQALKKGAHDYLMKDNLTRLVAAVEREIRESHERKALKKIESTLRDTENSYRHLIDAVKDYGIFILCPQGNILSWNLGAARITGYNTDEILKEPFSRFFTEEDVLNHKPQNALKQALDTGKYEEEGLCVHKNDYVFYSNTLVSPIYNEQSSLIGFSVILRDITERKENERKTREMAIELEKKVRERTAQLELVNKELESFSYSVSHDLRAPLRHLIGLSKILLSRYSGNLDEEGNKYLELILESANQMTKLITDLLALSRVSRSNLHVSLVNLSEMANDIIQQLSYGEPERQVEFKIAEDIHTLGDTSMLKIILQNLLDNAMKFTTHEEKAVIEFGTEVRNGKTLYFVRDNGIGFDPTYSYKLFGAFQRLHSEDEFPGSGIGLATVKRIIHRHGGKVWGESKPNEGAIFYFCLDLDKSTDVSFNAQTLPIDDPYIPHSS